MLNPKDVLEIEEDHILTKFPCEITIDKKEYTGFLEEYDGKYEIPGFVEIYFPEKEDYTQVITPYTTVFVLKTDNIEEDRRYIKIKYQADDKIIEKDYVETEISLPVISKMLEGRFKFIKEPEQLLFLLHQALPKSDLVHLELVLSNIFRDEETGEPCRFKGNYRNSIQIGVGQIALNDSWLSAIAFEHIDRGIRKALIKKQPAKMNPLEKVINEEFDI